MGFKHRIHVGVQRCCLILGIYLLTLICHGDVLIDLTYIGNPGNPDDDPPGDFIGGGVNYIYQIGTYETTVAQYTEFLNAKARSDPYGLYNSAMEGGTPEGAFIIRSGSDGSYTYTAVSGKENQPVRWVSFFDTLRFCNWMHNGQGDGDTETGAYNLSLGLSVEREPRATWALSSEDEWYKAAYYDPDAGVYYDYPNGSDDVPAEPTDGTTLREMNFGELPYWAPEGDRLYITSIGETTGRSPYGTYDQGGNVREWLETASIQFPDRNVRGGGTFSSEAEDLSSNRGFGYDPDAEGLFGFRLVHLIPEPSTALLGLSGLLVMGLLRRRRV